MAKVVLKTPFQVAAQDCHEFRLIVDVLNLDAFQEYGGDWGEVYRKTRRLGAKVALFPGNDGDTHWFYDGQYHAIVYVPVADDKEAQQIADEINTSLKRCYPPKYRTPKNKP